MITEHDRRITRKLLRDFEKLLGHLADPHDQEIARNQIAHIRKRLEKIERDLAKQGKES